MNYCTGCCSFYLGIHSCPLLTKGVLSTSTRASTALTEADVRRIVREEIAAERAHRDRWSTR